MALKRFEFTGGERDLRTVALFGLGAFGLLFGAAHLLYQLWQHWGAPALDYRFFWLAGDLWASGQTPYDQTFTTRAADEFAILEGAVWYYPPSWFAVTVPFALLEPLNASRLWLVTNCVMLVAASAANVYVFKSLRGKSLLFRAKTPLIEALHALHPLVLFGLHFGLVATMQSVGNTIHLGQSSIIVYLGASLVALGAVRRSTVTGAIGIALMMLKPQIGILVVIALAISAYGRRIIFCGALISFIVAAPALVITPMPDVLTAMLASSSDYVEHPYNLPAAMTGLIHLVWQLGDNAPNATIFILTSVVITCALALSGALSPRIKSIDAIAIAIITLLAIMPLHIYDFTLLGVIVFLLPQLRASSGVIGTVAMLSIWRAGNIPHLPAFSENALVYYPGSTYASLAAAVLFIHLAIAVFRRRNSPRTRTNGDFQPHPA